MHTGHSKRLPWILLVLVILPQLNAYLIRLSTKDIITTNYFRNLHDNTYLGIIHNVDFNQADFMNFTVGLHNKLILGRIAEPKKVLTLPPVHSTKQIKSYYQHLRLNRFDSFFRVSGVDVPKCFNRSKSLKRKHQGFLFLRMINFYMRHGLRLRALKLFNNIFYSMSWGFLGSSKDIEVGIRSWQQLFTNLTLVNNTTSQNYTYNRRGLNLQGSHLKKYSWYMADQSYSNGSDKHYNTTKSIYNMLFGRIKKIEPMYNFYVYRVAKKIYKNSRGKSGRYTFVWKYIAPYKRTYVTYYWLFKELQLRTNKQITKRVLKLIRRILFEPQTLWASRVSRFSVLYVYRHCRVTLAENYRSIVK